jgi:hypothetical protein
MFKVSDICFRPTRVDLPKSYQGQRQCFVLSAHKEVFQLSAPAYFFLPRLTPDQF